MEADALSESARCEIGVDRGTHPPMAYLVVVRKGPTWELSDMEQFCRLLSRRFIGEVWAHGSYEVDTVIGRMRLRVVDEQLGQNTTNRVRFIRAIRRWVEQLRSARPPRLVFVALNPFMSGLIALYAAKRAHGTLICELNGVYASRHNTANTRLALLRPARVLARRLVGSYVLNRASGIRLLFADQLRDFIRLPRGIPARQFFAMPNLESFYPGAEERIILGAGFPLRTKGFDLLCQAFKKIASDYSQWKLVLIGHGIPEEVRAGGFEHPRIETHPGLKEPQVAEWMARCAIFVLPSRTEGMGKVLLESGAAGKCRVATRVDGIPTVVEDGVDGLLVEPENVEELAAALERLMGDPGLRQRLGDAAKRRIEREFSAEAYVNHYGELVAAALRHKE